MLRTASSAVPRLIPAPIIGCSLTYKILIYNRLLSIGFEHRCSRPAPSAPGLNGSGAGRFYVRGDGQDDSFGFARNLDGRMEEFGERFNAHNKSWAGPRKIAIRFQGVNAPVADRRHGIPLLGKIYRAILVAGFLGPVAARCDKQNFRFSLHDILQMDTDGR